MAKIRYLQKRLNSRTRLMMEECNKIIVDFQSQGYTLTLRQLYYQLVKANLIPNNKKSYDNLGTLVNNARLAGFIDWDAIEDRTRGLAGVPHRKDVESAIDITAYSYRIDKWVGQDYRPEIWVEKEALAGVVERSAVALDVNFLSCKGYMSQSEMHAAALRFVRYLKNGQEPVVIHLGDHDPSGVDMSRDIMDRLEMFIRYYTGSPFEVKRIALNMNQIEEHDLPPNFAKSTDVRFEGYVEKYGEESWELDALNPTVLDGLISEAVFQFRDLEIWRERAAQERRERLTLGAISQYWPDLERALSGDSEGEIIRRRDGTLVSLESASHWQSFRDSVREHIADGEGDEDDTE